MRHIIIVFGYRQLTAKKATSPFGVWCKFKEPLLSVPQHFVPFQFIMKRDFEKSTGISFLFLLCLISVPNIFILIVLYRNPLRCFRKAFSVFLVFICAVDLFIGIVVCSGETLMRFLCAFGDQRIPQEGDIPRIMGYTELTALFYWQQQCPSTAFWQLFSPTSIAVNSSLGH